MSVRKRKSARAETDARSSRCSTVRSSTASVALCVAAAKAVRPNSKHFSRIDVRSPCATRMKSASTDRPVKMSVSSVLASHGNEVVRTSTRLMARSRNGWGWPSTRSVNCRIHSVASALIPRLIQKLEFLAEMKIEAERGGAAGHQIAFIPPCQVAAGIPLEQGIAIPQGRGQQHQWDGDGGDPGRPRIRSGPRPQYLRAGVAFPHQGSICRMVGLPKFANSRTPAGLISRNR